MTQSPYGRPHDAPAAAPPGGALQPDPQDRTAAILAHASGLIAMFVTGGWVSFAGPLLVWLVYKDRSPFVRQSAAGSFNFNLGMWVLSIVGWVMVLSLLLLPVGVVLLAVSFVAQLVCHVMGIVKAADGAPFRYPAQLPVLH